MRRAGFGDYATNSVSPGFRAGQAVLRAGQRWCGVTYQAAVWHSAFWIITNNTTLKPEPQLSVGVYGSIGFVQTDLWIFGSVATRHSRGSERY